MSSIIASSLTVVGLLIYSPDPRITPGAVDPTKNAEILCDKSYTTKKVRPPDSFTTALKNAQIRAWKLAGAPKDYEEDHLISLELGGAPRSNLNLWPQPWCPSATAGKTCFGAKEKDEVENWLHKQVCLGKMDLGQAQEAIRTDWFSVYKKIHAY